MCENNKTKLKRMFMGGGLEEHNPRDRRLQLSNVLFHEQNQAYVVVHLILYTFLYLKYFKCV